MKFRAVRPDKLGSVDAIVVPLFADTPPPSWLPRATRTAIARIQKQRVALVARKEILLRRERDDVRHDQRPIHVRRSPQRSVGTDGDEHFLGVTE